MIGRALRKLGTGILFLVIALCVTIVVVPTFLDRIYYRGAASANFDGKRFFNPDGDDDTLRMPRGKNGGNFAWRYLTGSDGRPSWPDHVAVVQSKPAPRIAGERMVATWIGHATVLVQTQGLNILTDPIYSERAGPLGVGPRRVARPGVEFDDLPKIDLVLVSHNHYDHMDIGTLKRLWDRDKPLIVTGLGNDALLRAAGIDAVARGWGGRVAVRPGIDVIVTRNHHWSSRWGVDRNRALWSSFVVALPGGSIMFAGDTGMGDGQWPVEARRYGPIRLAIIPIGAFRFVPGQMGVGSHIGPIDAAEVFVRSGARSGIGIHWGTFRLSSEAYDTPPRLLARVAICRRLSGFGTTAIGEAREIMALDVPQPPLSRYALPPSCAARPFAPDLK